MKTEIELKQILNAIENDLDIDELSIILNVTQIVLKKKLNNVQAKLRELSEKLKQRDPNIGQEIDKVWDLI